ncbi:amino acid permease [Exiguobacterium flavidum]|uniref:amino acid permease n=1 Tax=Exiguobacterium flavidum TaxID=2184695 RepID=UPI000DF7A055|nr:amino acid permease [Exiguobacterium flavidum]
MSLLRKKDVSVMLDAGSHSKLARHLSGIDLVLLGIGAIIGTGIFVLTGTGALYAGPALPVSFIISAIVCALAALCYAEFSSMIPVSGSVYTYTYATLGELIAWIIGWDLLLEYGLAASAVATGWSGYFQSLLAGFGLELPKILTAAPGAVPGETTYFNLPAFAVLMVITLLLSRGIKETKRINNIMVLVKVAVVILFIVVGIWYVEPGNYQPFAPFGVSGILQASAIAFFAYLGFDAVTSAAEEVKDPGRNLPIGILGSLAIVTVLYVIVSAIMVGIVPFKQFEGVDSPVSLALKVAGQDWVAGFVDLGAIVGMTTVILVMTYGLIRLLFAMSRDGLLPAVFSDVDEKTHTPVKATWILGTIAALLAGFVPLGTLAELINIGTLAAFALISVAIIILRKTQPDMKRVFKVPFVPVLPILSVLACFLLMTNLAGFTWIAFFIWTGIGLLIYFGYGRRRSNLHQ